MLAIDLLLPSMVETQLGEYQLNEPNCSFPEFLATSGTLIRTLSGRHPDSCLVVLGNQRYTYRQIDEASQQLACGLIAAGCGKGSRIGLLAPNGPDWIIGWLAATRIGALVALLNTYDKARELERNLRLADVQILLCVQRHLSHDYLMRLEEIAPAISDQASGDLRVPALPFLRSVYCFGESDRTWVTSTSELIVLGSSVSQELLVAIEEQVVPADPMVIVFSSGSTTEPKGVVHGHGAVVRHAHNLSQFRDLRINDVVYSSMPLFWVGGLSYTLIAVMHAGAALLTEDQFEPGETLALIERERCTHVLGWPHVSKALADHPTFFQRDLSSIRNGSLGLPLANGALAIDPSRRPNALGMTETLGPHTLEREGSELSEGQIGSFGRSVPGVEHRVVDPLTGSDVEIGEFGELWVRGYSLMQQLYKRERADTFTPDGWYRTGDGGFFDSDGHFYFKGRLGEQIKSSGMNITPGEVEIVLEEIDEVMMAFVVGVSSRDRGQDVVAAVVPKSGREIDISQLIPLLGKALASYKVPRHILIIADPTGLPWLVSGKVDRRALQGRLEQQFGLG